MTDQTVILPGASKGQMATLPTAATPMQIIVQAVANGAPVETMEKLLAMQERWEANEARKAFVTAMAAFRAQAPLIEKTKGVKDKNGKEMYKHATLDAVCNQVGPMLGAHGISYGWETSHGDQGRIRVTCVLTHQLGHAERNYLEAGADMSGNKNAVQAIGSTVTYLQRYTLLAACGLATQDQDDDGRGQGGHTDQAGVGTGYAGAAPEARHDASPAAPEAPPPKFWDRPSLTLADASKLPAAIYHCPNEVLLTRLWKDNEKACVADNTLNAAFRTKAESYPKDHVGREFDLPPTHDAETGEVRDDGVPS